jgi:hypothetical protein
MLPGQATGYTAHRKFSQGGFQSLHTGTLGGLEQALFLAERACWTRRAGGGPCPGSTVPGDADGCPRRDRTGNSIIMAHAQNTRICSCNAGSSSQSRSRRGGYLRAGADQRLLPAVPPISCPAARGSADIARRVPCSANYGA